MRNSVLQQTAMVDPASGNYVIKMGDKRLEIMLQQMNDRFYLETGYRVLEVTRFL